MLRCGINNAHERSFAAANLRPAARRQTPPPMFQFRGRYSSICSSIRNPESAIEGRGGPGRPPVRRPGPSSPCAAEWGRRRIRRTAAARRATRTKCVGDTSARAMCARRGRAVNSRSWGWPPAGRANMRVSRPERPEQTGEAGGLRRHGIPLNRARDSSRHSRASVGVREPRTGRLCPAAQRRSLLALRPEDRYKRFYASATIVKERLSVSSNRTLTAC
jgi:hypothetical protein